MTSNEMRQRQGFCLPFILLLHEMETGIGTRVEGFYEKKSSPSQVEWSLAGFSLMAKNWQVDCSWCLHGSERVQHR